MAIKIKEVTSMDARYEKEFVLVSNEPLSTKCANCHKDIECNTVYFCETYKLFYCYDCEMNTKRLLCPFILTFKKPKHEHRRIREIRIQHLDIQTHMVLI